MEHFQAFQKQDKVFLNSKERLLGVGAKSSKNLRYVRKVGLGFPTPDEAVKGTYIDKKCPWTGNVSIRGKILTGVCLKNKMQRTIVMRRFYLHFVRKYRRYETRYTNIHVHCSPAFRVEPGDIITAGECRPLAKHVMFNVLKVAKAPGKKKVFEKF